MPARERLSDEVRLVARIELVAEVLDMPLDGSRGDAELLGALLRGEALRDAVKHLALALRQTDEVFLLAREIHHLLRNRRKNT